jgi:hypothetical protein
MPMKHCVKLFPDDMRAAHGIARVAPESEAAGLADLHQFKEASVSAYVNRGGVFAKFLDKEILGEQGRLLFSLLNAFATSGYHVRLCDNLQQTELGKYGGLTHSIKGVTLTDAIPANTADLIYLYDRQDREAGSHPWRKKVHVKYDIFARYWLGRPIVMPFPLHPAHAGPDLPQRLEDLRSSKRKMRVFFAGDTNGYVRNRIHYPAEKLPRSAVVNGVLQRLGARALSVNEKGALDNLLSAQEYANKCVVVDANSFRVEEGRWLKTVASSDFFLCPPGYVMPMCHNVIEAMAVGTIPVISYPEWFDPALKNMENCIIFGDERDLIAKMHGVLAMDQRQIAEMRQNVIDYYDTHLTADAFTRNLESRPGRRSVVLLITEKYVAQHASRLGPHSVLMRGSSPTAAKRLSWLQRQLSR